MNTVIHDAFRRDLQRFDDGFGTFPDGFAPRADQLTAAWTHFAHQLHIHHDDEETGFWPAFRELGADAALMADLEREHETMIVALDAAQAAVDGFAATPSAATAASARAAIGELTRVISDHLAHEERDLNPFSDRHRSTRQVKAATAAARKMHTEGAGPFFAWLTDDCSQEDTSALRQEVPAPVLFVLVKLGARKYQRAIESAWSQPRMPGPDPGTTSN